MTRFDFSLATQADDAQLRERMAHDWIQGAAAISLRREPSYFDACRLQGDSVQVLTGRERASGRIVVMGSRCITTTFVNGRPERTAHLADLRIHPDYRSGTLLARTYRYLRTLHEADPLPCFTLIYDDNATALNSLVGGRAGLPTYLPRGRLVAPAIHLAKCRPELTVSGVELRRARPDELPAIVEFLNRHRADHLWAPVLSIDDFRPGGRCGTLQAKDFFLALRQGRVCATLATWDQSSLRQAHVERYASPTAWLRPGLQPHGPSAGTAAAADAGQGVAVSLSRLHRRRRRLGHIVSRAAASRPQRAMLRTLAVRAGRIARERSAVGLLCRLSRYVVAGAPVRSRLRRRNRQRARANRERPRGRGVCTDLRRAQRTASRRCAQLRGWQNGERPRWIPCRPKS
ncbi:hypothetical protein AB3X96_39875 [Paraburkholderia sp. BR13439]|uniref:hypothetical protein n=1 Tax=Paraburkholderia sp. BR13439 TaxID=3236996 RepID=UPI0034CDE3E7